MQAGRYVFVGGLCVATLVSASAAEAGVRLGPIAGFSRTGWSSAREDALIISAWRSEIGFFGGAPSDLGNVSRFSAGAVIEVDLADRVSLVFQPGTSGKGSEWQTEDRSVLFEFRPFPAPPRQYPSTATFHWEQRTRHFELPILLKYSFTNRGLRPYVLGGPTIDFLSSARLRVTREVQTDAPAPLVASRFGADDEETQNVRTRFIGLEAGLVMGVGASLRLGPGDLFVEGQYSVGLTNIDKEARDHSVKASGYRLKGGITFPLGGR